MANQTIMRLDMYCDKCKKVALQSVTKIGGIDRLAIDMSQRTLSVIGDADPVEVANQLRKKFRCAELLYAGPVPKPPPPPPPKVEPKKDKEEKKDEKKEEKKVVEEKVVEEKKEEKVVEEKKEEKVVEEKKEEKVVVEQKKEEKVEEKRTEVVTRVEVQPCPCMNYTGPCYPPCPACTSRPDIMWPTYHPARTPNEVWYVWNEEKQDSCTIC